MHKNFVDLQAACCLVSYSIVDYGAAFPMNGGVSLQKAVTKTAATNRISRLVFVLGGQFTATGSCGFC